MSSPSDQLRLDLQLCFALYAATNAVTRAYRSRLAAVGLTYPQYLVMLVLWEHGRQTVKGLADKLALDSSTLTPLLKRLAAAELVTRMRDTHDERLLWIELTPAGLGLRQPVAAIQKSVACRTRLSDRDFTNLRQRLHELVEAMQIDEMETLDAP